MSHKLENAELSLWCNHPRQVINLLGLIQHRQKNSHYATSAITCKMDILIHIRNLIQCWLQNVPVMQQERKLWREITKQFVKWDCLAIFSVNLNVFVSLYISYLKCILSLWCETVACPQELQAQIPTGCYIKHANYISRGSRETLHLQHLKVSILLIFFQWRPCHFCPGILPCFMPCFMEKIYKGAMSAVKHSTKNYKIQSTEEIFPFVCSMFFYSVKYLNHVHAIIWFMLVLLEKT